jgi:PAS domain S-box-containing protein
VSKSLNEVKHKVNKKKRNFGKEYFNMKRTLVLVVIPIVVLLVGALYLGILSARHMKEIISGDFNQQQLVLAKYAASRMENSLDFIKREISLLNLSPSIQYLEKVSWASRMNTTLSAVKDDGVLEVRLVDRKGRTSYIVDNMGMSHVIQGHFTDTEYFKWAILKENENRIYVGKITKESRGYPDKLVMIVATPTYEKSVDEAYPVPTGRLSGVLLFTVDVAYLAEKAIKGIRSGKTGYAWVIDSRGVFLYHPEKEFIGEDAFRARTMKKPKISFAQINMIQKEKMLKGKEGTGWYISGWHRGIETEMKKLIAYAPVYLKLRYIGNWFWSVAVVAPTSEVEGAIHSVYTRQFYIQGTIIFVIIFSSIYVIGFERRWAKALEEEVTKKTKDLKKSEERYKTLVESAKDLIFTVNEKGALLSINRCAANFFERRPEDLIGKNISNLFSKKSAELQMGFVRHVFATGRNINEKHPARIGKHDYWFTSNFVALKDEHGKVFAALGISRDITERKKLEEEQMYNTEKLASLGKLTAGVAHELKNPVSIILGFTDFLLEKTECGSKNHEMCESIQRQALNCKNIVGSILGFAGYSKIIEYVTDVNVNLERVLSVVEDIFLATKKITIEKNLADDLPKARGDSGHLQQVFMNLITNAVASMEGGGVLTVSTRLNGSGNRVEILFKDMGHGIKREYRDKIFDAFFTTKKVGEGTGLGLSVSYGIVTKYGGDITFETVAEEEDREKKGTTFTVSLPVALPENEQVS